MGVPPTERHGPARGVRNPISGSTATSGLSEVLAAASVSQTTGHRVCPDRYHWSPVVLDTCWTQLSLCSRWQRQDVLSSHHRFGELGGEPFKRCPGGAYASLTALQRPRRGPPSLCSRSASACRYRPHGESDDGYLQVPLSEQRINVLCLELQPEIVLCVAQSVHSTSEAR